MNNLLLVWRDGIMGNVRFFMLSQDSELIPLLRKCNGIFIDHMRQFPDYWHSIYELNSLISKGKIYPINTKQIKNLTDQGNVITEVINCGKLT